MTTQVPAEKEGMQALEQPKVTSGATPTSSSADVNEASLRIAPITPEREAPPSPPRGGFGGFIQRMSPGGRWMLGLSLAVLSSFAYLTVTAVPSYGWSLGFVTAFVLALLAGVALARWWAGVALIGALAVGGASASALVVLLSPPSSIEGASGVNAFLIMLAFFGLLNLLPLSLFAFGGIGLGHTLGMTLGRSAPLSAGNMRVSRWIGGLGPVVAAAMLTPGLGNLPGMLGMQVETGSAVELLPGIAYAIALATTCFLAGWTLRSVWGGVVAIVVYLGVAFLASVSLGGGGAAMTLVYGLLLYILLPAVVMSAIGTGIGMFRARHRRL